MEEKQSTLTQFFREKERKRDGKKDEELLKLQEMLGVYAWILFGE
ncbi:MAG: hypothetical protein QXN34_06825 [Archaeoglobaceae archaeon]